MRQSCRCYRPRADLLVVYSAAGCSGHDEEMVIGGEASSGCCRCILSGGEAEGCYGCSLLSLS